jgi:DNA-binding transcriptional ArsR family regulator
MTDLDPWPDRLVMRAIVLFQTRVGIYGIRLVGGDLVTWILLAPLIRRTLVEHACAPALSVNAIATSAAIPYETARRHLAMLLDAGLCERSEKGIKLAGAFADDPRYRAFERHLTDELAAFLGTLRALDVPLPRGGEPIIDDLLAFATAAMDLSLVAMEFWHTAYRHPLDMLVFAGVSVENCYPFTADRAACRRYGDWDTPPPEAIKRPVSAAALAARLDLPYATLWRSVRRLRDTGLVTLTAAGLVSQNRATDDTLREGRNQMIAYFRSRLTRLARAGVDLDAVARANLVDRDRLDRDLHDDPYLGLPRDTAASAAIQIG